MSDQPSASALPGGEEDQLSAQCRRLAQADRQGLDALTSQLCVYDLPSIVTFGGEAAKDLARCSDAVLQSIRKGQAGDAGPLLSALSSVMKQFSAEDFDAGKAPRKGRFPFGRKPKPLTQDQLLEKYRAIGEEVDRVYIELKKYEADIRARNQGMKAVYEANLRYYQNLVRYILAGEQGLEEIRAHIGNMEAELAQNPGNTALKMDLDTVRQARAALERRVQDLRTAEIAALQSLPMLQTVQNSNSSLIQKIDAAFLVTLPIFKRTLSQAVARKRQRLQTQAMEALDRRTQEALGKQRASAQAGTDAGAAQLETLAQVRETILTGIEEALALQREAGARQAAAEARLNAGQ